MAIVEIERIGGTMVIRMNRPERLNALGDEMVAALADAWREFRDTDGAEVAIFTGTGRAFCAGADMKEAVERGGATNRTIAENPYDQGSLDKPVIAAVNGFAMGGGFMLAERADLRIAVRGAVFEMSEAKRFLLGGYYHGFIGGLSHAIGTEMAFAFRFAAERLHELGWVNRLVEDDAEMMAQAQEMADHLLSLPPAARVNTLAMMRAMRPRVAPELDSYANRLREHGAKSDLMESRRAFAEKRRPNFLGWNAPADRFRTPRFE